MHTGVAYRASCGMQDDVFDIYSIHRLFCMAETRSLHARGYKMVTTILVLFIFLLLLCDI